MNTDTLLKKRQDTFHLRQTAILRRESAYSVLKDLLHHVLIRGWWWWVNKQVSVRVVELH